MIDLHLHTNCSDGSCSPAEVLSMAEEKGITLLSITDHQSVNAYEALKDPTVRGRFSGKILPGVEIATVWRGYLIDILGYGCDYEKIAAYLACRREMRGNYTQRVLELLYARYQKIGVRMDLKIEDYSKEKHRTAFGFFFSMLQHPDNKKFFLDPANRAGRSIWFRKEATNPKSPLYFDQSPFFDTPRNTVRAIQEAGGKTILAHCFQYSEEIYDHLDELVEELKVDGIECRYPTFTPAQTAYVEDFCRKRGLLMSGGSDFHGVTRPDNEMGTDINGSLYVDPAMLGWTEEYLQ